MSIYSSCNVFIKSIEAGVLMKFYKGRATTVVGCFLGFSIYADTAYGTLPFCSYNDVWQAHL